MSRAARRLSLAALIAAVPLLALAGRQVGEGIHGPPEASFWSFTVGTSFGETTPDVEDTTIPLDDESPLMDFLWGGGLAAAGGVFLVLGVRDLRRSDSSG